MVGLWNGPCGPPAESFRRNFGGYWRRHKRWLKEISGHDPDAEAPWFDLYRPIQNISSQFPPTVLIHGTEDDEVPYAVSVGMDDALTKAGIPHKLITVPGGAHVLRGLSEVETMRITDKELAFAKPYLSWWRARGIRWKEMRRTGHAHFVVPIVQRRRTRYARSRRPGADLAGFAPDGTAIRAAFR